jgi:hypothetical protein
MSRDLAAPAAAARRSEETGAPALDFEITPEMIAAGREELAGYSHETRPRRRSGIRYLSGDDECST